MAGRFGRRAKDGAVRRRPSFGRVRQSVDDRTVDENATRKSNRKKYIVHGAIKRGRSESAGMNRSGVEDERVLQRRFSQPG